MLTFATYFDSGFLVRGVACLDSLAARCTGPVTLVVLALDEHCATVLPRALAPLPPGCRLVVHALPDFEARHPELAAARSQRSRLEYYFTLTPLFCAEAVAAAPPGELVVYVDADMFCFADPAPTLTEADGADVMLTEHRFPPANAYLADTYGRFNVGWLAFRNAPGAHRCLERWAAQCLEWCSVQPEPGRFGDQKYLDDWPATVPSLAVLGHPGVNAAPWNAATHRIEASDAGTTVDGRPLVAFHFHRLRRLRAWRYETDFRDYGRIAPAVARHVYLPYLAVLEATAARLGEARLDEPPLGHGADSKVVLPPRRPLLRSAAGRLARSLRLFTGQRVVFSQGTVLGPVRALLGLA